MSEPLDVNGFSRNPKNVAPDCWYYEDRAGLQVYWKGSLICILPWRSIEASVRRKQRAKDSPR